MIKRLFISLFFILCLIPLGAMFAEGFYTEENGEYSFIPDVALVDENKKLNINYLSELSDWFDDNHGIKKPFISFYNKGISLIFGESAEEEVILGKDGWMFYAQTLSDYEGSDKMSEREVFSSSRVLWLMNEYAKKNEMDFLFVIAPNKNSLYPDKMPDFYPRAEGKSDAQRLMDLLEENKVSYVDLFEVIGSEAKPLYLKTDSHWTTEGASLAADAILKEAKGEEEGFYGRSTTLSEPVEGDLFKMIYPSFKNTERDVIYNREFSFRYQRPIRSVEDISIKTLNDNREGTMFMFRDSFGNALYPFIAEAYGKCVFSRINPYNLVLPVNEGADVFAVELVERNLDWLLTKPPIFPSPEGDISINELLTADASLNVSPSEEMPGYSKIEGTINDDIPETQSLIYITFKDKTYEAVPGENNSFTAYIPSDFNPEEISVIIK